jgi:hypothetical protein
MTETEFAEAKKFWVMFQANETFKAVQQGCLELSSSGLSQDSPLYFPLKFAPYIPRLCDPNSADEHKREVRKMLEDAEKLQIEAIMKRLDVRVLPM